MSKFIYVFTEEAMKRLTKEGYELCRKDEKNSIWIFFNKDPENLSFSPDFQCVLSNVLSF